MHGSGQIDKLNKLGNVRIR